MVRVISVKVKPGEKCESAAMRGSIWQCQEVPLPALPWPEPPNLKASELMIDYVDTPWAVKILWTICTRVRV